jgi:hypothetical protein
MMIKMGPLGLRIGDFMKNSIATQDVVIRVLLQKAILLGIVPTRRPDGSVVDYIWYA